MDLHTKELQSMNSAVAAQHWTPSKCFQPAPAPPANSDF